MMDNFLWQVTQALKLQSTRLPPPCFTLGMMFLYLNTALALHQMYRDPPLPKSPTLNHQTTEHCLKIGFKNHLKCSSGTVNAQLFNLISPQTILQLLGGLLELTEMNVLTALAFVPIHFQNP